MKTFICTLILGLVFAGLPAQAQEREVYIFPPRHGWVCNSEQTAIRFALLRNDGMTEAEAAERINADEKSSNRCNERKFYAQEPEVTFGEMGNTRFELRAFDVIGIKQPDLSLKIYRPSPTYYDCKFIHTDKG